MYLSSSQIKFNKEINLKKTRTFAPSLVENSLTNDSCFVSSLSIIDGDQTKSVTSTLNNHVP